jgi:hypothetical protein
MQAVIFTKKILKALAKLTKMIIQKGKKLKKITENATINPV